ncbi:MAG: winged helix-turn-helix transcriptional regulator [Planctomycetes bacterium]|nr:winged helix-turn-helix transcriptional regulator [Planctomycetota bacterium]
MDLIVKTCRILASRVRLRMLQAIYRSPGITVQDMAKCAGVADFAASKHLKLLADCHLVQTTPSGRYVHCSPPSPRTTSNRFLTDMQELVRELFGERANRTPAQVCDWLGASDETSDAAFSAVIRHVTVYTHLRRLLILREFIREGNRSVEDLIGALNMSPDAAARHLDKLQRRGMVKALADEPSGWKLVAQQVPPFQKALLSAVAKSLKAKREG